MESRATITLTGARLETAKAIICGTRPYPFFGYAPGAYLGHCPRCNDRYMGDKRSYSCEPCAVHAALGALAAEEARILYDRAPQHDTRVELGDDFSADGWIHRKSGALYLATVGYDPNAGAEQAAATLDIQAELRRLPDVRTGQDLASELHRIGMLAQARDFSPAELGRWLQEIGIPMARRVLDQDGRADSAAAAHGVIQTSPAA